jgi:exosortase A
MTIAVKNNMAISQQTGWRYFLPVIVIYLLLYTALFYETFGSMVSIWMRSETFTHAFLILPISIWLVWEKREHLQYERPQPSWLGMIALIGCGFMWLFGYLVDALVVQQFAWVAAFISGIWAILGNRVAWAIAFPLGFLVFLIPFGEDLVPAMMEFTADFTVAMVRLTGIPVYREGLFFTLPSGNWSVVEACSGIRYLIASLTLGCLYSYLTYTSLKKRLIFIIISIIVPIIANGFRAYIIVMLGHVSDMKVATGFDHIIYGWVFFGFVIFILIMIGSRFRDADIDKKPDAKKILAMSNYVGGLKQAIQSAIVAIVLIGFWPVLAYEVKNQEVNKVASGIEPIPALEDWTILDQSDWQWQPVSVGAEKLNQYFKKENVNIGMYLQYYFAQDQGAELINWRNVLLAPDLNGWRIIHQQKVDINIASKQVNVDETLIKGPDVQLLVWSWYRIGEYYTANKYAAKLLEGWAKISFSRSDAGKIIVAIPYDDNSNQIERAVLLQSFITEIMPDVEHSIDKAAGAQ